jgi:hypothetical protein
MFVVLECVYQTSATKEIEHNMNPYISSTYAKKNKSVEKMIFRAQNGKNNARCPILVRSCPKLNRTWTIQVHPHVYLPPWNHRMNVLQNSRSDTVGAHSSRTRSPT